MKLSTELKYMHILKVFFFDFLQVYMLQLERFYDNTKKRTDCVLIGACVLIKMNTVIKFSDYSYFICTHSPIRTQSICF